MYDTSKGIRVSARPANTNGGEGFVIEIDGYPFEAGMGEACAVLHALRTKGEAAARRALDRVLKDRIAGKGKR
jgi:hypothetical protein